MFNAGRRGKRTKDGAGIISVGAHFNQQEFLIPTITGYSVTGDSDYEADDLALDTAGGQTITINGSGFKSGAQVRLDNSVIGSVSVTPTAISFTAPAKTAGTYTLYVTNPNGGTAVLTPGVLYSGFPSWTSPAAGAELGPYYETTSYLDSFEATNPQDAGSSIVYSLYDGAFPAGATLDSNAGTLSGTAPVDGGSTTYSFTIKATDSDLQDTLRSFTLTVNTDVVTWSAPDTSQTLYVNSAITPLTLSASSAVGYGVSYAADSLPTGLTLANDSISGTPTVVGSQYTTLTATAATTSRTATRTITWSIQVAADPYFKNVTALLQADNDIYLADVSSSQHLLTENGDVKPTSFSPYKGSYYSTRHDGAGDYIEIDAADTTSMDFGTGDFTIEVFFYRLTSAIRTEQIWQFSSGPCMLIYSNALYYQSTPGSSIHYATMPDPGFSKWQHYAMVRENGVLRIFADGVFIAGGAATTNYADVGSLRLGEGNYADSLGYFHSFRVTNGSALYDMSGSPTLGDQVFTPPTEPLTTTSQGATASEVKLLTCQSNRIIDNSLNNLSITVAGNTSVSGHVPWVADSSYADYGSAYFDGTGDYFTAPASNDFVFGSSDFTIDAWVYPTTTGTERGIVNNWQTGGNFIFRILNTNKLNIIYSAPGSIQKTSTDTVPYNQWSHVVVERYNNNIYFYINGVADSGGAQSETGTISYASKDLKIGTSGDTNNLWNGWISDLRIVKGSAVYQAAFSVPTTSLTAVTDTKLLTLQTNKPITNKTFVDKSSLSALITTTGDAYQGSFTPYSPFGYSNYFDGTGDYLAAADANSALDFGTGDFTVEFWVNFSDISADRGFVGSNATAEWDFCWRVSTGLNIGRINTLFDNTFAWSPVAHTWYHVAYCRSGTDLRVFVDGTQVGSTVTNSNDYHVTTCIIGGSTPGARLMNGYLSNVRLTNAALYTSNFTPSTTTLTPTSDTSLLVCQSPSLLIDNSKNRLSVTRANDVRVSSYTPFAGHTVTPDSHSVYFDGTGDYLRFPSNADYAFGTDDFTVECWFYITSALATNDGLVGNDTTPGWQISANGSGFCFMGDGSNRLLTTDDLNLNQWYHIAYCRSGSTLYGFLDGVAIGTSTAPSVSTNFTNQIIDVGVNRGGTPSTEPLTTTSQGATASEVSLLTCQSSTVVDNSLNSNTVTGNGNAQAAEFNPFGFTTTTGVVYDPDIHGGSVHLSTSGQYLSWPADTHYTISTGDFTYQCWLWPEGLGTQRAFIDLRGQNGSPRGPMFYTTTSNTLTWFNGSGTGGGGTILGNQWNHVVLTRSDGTIRIYLNGIQTYSAANSDNYALNNSGTIYIGRQQGSTSNDFIGWISDVQVINDKSLYTANFTPPKRLIRHSKEILAAQFNDAAIHDAKARTSIKTVGDAKVSNAFKKYGSGSMYFDGSGDALVSVSFVPTFYNNMTNPGSQYINTIEMWIYPTTLTSPRSHLIGAWTGTSGGTGWTYDIDTSGRIFITNNSAGTTMTSMTGAAAITTNAWQHLAFVNDGTDIKIYLDGTLVATKTGGSACGAPSTSLYIGVRSDNVAPFQGYIDDLRITKGVARYTSTFTPPTEAFISK